MLRRLLLTGFFWLGAWGLSGESPVPQTPVRVAFYEFGLLYHSGEGLDKDLTEAVGRRLGLKFSAQVLARARIWQDLQNGDLDLATSAIITPERDQFAWQVPYLATKNLAIVTTQVASTVKSFDQFNANKNLVWGAVTSFKHGTEQDKWIDILRSEGRLEESTDAEALFRKLKEGRIAGLFSSPPMYKKYLADLNMASLVSLQDWTPKEKGFLAGFALSKRRFSEADAKRWAATLQAMKDDGTLKALYSKYLSPSEVARVLDF
ncbi:MAG: transporter substrate-binding domain-containing protein [Spirochaetales bacterium]